MKKSSVYLPIIISCAMAAGLILGSALHLPSSGVASSRNNSKNKLNRLLDFIDREYVDQVNTDSIVDVTVSGILAQLDPHSVYLSPELQSDEQEIMKGDFVGIGIHFYMFRDTVAVIKPIAGSPSEKAGLKAGDRILFADRVKLFGRKLPSDSLYARLKGKQGSAVELTVYRKSENKQFKVKLLRDLVPLKSVETATLIGEKTGYVKITRFAETTFREFESAVADLKESGINKLVIDLRGNGGGYMESAVQIADEFLKEGEPIVFLKDRNGNTERTIATDKGTLERFGLAVLIDESSASASEILAGAIQDNDRGVIIGRRSFGKGLVQREMDFEDGSAVRLTVARYYTPTGRSIQKPYEKGNEEAYTKEFSDRFESGELYEKDQMKIADSLKFKTPAGKIVYGGGGIVPDVFVPLEGKKGESGLNYILEQSALVSQFVFEALDHDRRLFKDLSWKQFTAQLNQKQSYFKIFQKYLLRKDIRIDLSGSRTLVTKYLTAEFARQLFGDKAYYSLILKEDPLVKAALRAQKKQE